MQHPIRKTIVSIIAMLTAMTHSYGGDEMQSIKLQMLDSEIEKLTKERDTKYEQLKKCEKTTKGFKIAGITTLSLTAVGVAANIGEAHKIKENKGIITSNDATIKAKEEAIRKEEERKQQEKAEEARRLAAQQNGQSGQTSGTTSAEVVTDEEGTDETNPTTPATGTQKKSKYMPSCGSNAKAGEECTLNPNASKAICMDLGNTDEKGKVLLTCTAKECVGGYLLRLNSEGTSNGRCDTKESAENYCKNQGNNCKPKYRKNPNNNVADAAYIFHECDCGGTTNTKNSGSSSSNSSSSNNTAACKEKLANNGTYYVSKSLDGRYCEGWDGSSWFGTDEGGQCSDSAFTGLTNGQWKVKFSYGEVTGIAKCAANGGTYAAKGNPSGSNGKYCWCQRSNTTISECSAVASPSWVFDYDFGSAAGCARNCALGCARIVDVDSGFRRAVFGVVGD